TAVCWGPDWGGRLDVPEGRYAAITVNSHSCAIRTGGTAVCWGPDWGGQLDAPEGRYAAISAGSRHLCAIRTDGTAVCWNWATNLPAGVAWEPKSGG
ncbi:MAG: RCC1 domain-containing protein, partial [Caldilineaceae bacterium]|nr:RCC1 domain-containing protein [Caldilineaceae bacterium]